MKKTEARPVRVLGAKDIQKNLERCCREILKSHQDAGQLVFIGIRTRGIHLARRLSEIAKKRAGREIPLGEMDITLYRDDLNTLLPDGKVDNTRIPFDIANRTIILVDDVLHTGRTARAAVDHLIDFGRPKAIHLAVLIDRGGRELPIAADYVGKKVAVPAGGDVQVRLKEVDKTDEVVISKAQP
ncbi:MAG TPA: bifunctional pyr operon transcriptional regulator/uracil phosphoribosyltransferase PyrR [Candidatus Binatia bacterium]